MTVARAVVCRASRTSAGVLASARSRKSTSSSRENAARVAASIRSTASRNAIASSQSSRARARGRQRRRGPVRSVNGSSGAPRVAPPVLESCSVSPRAATRARRPTASAGFGVLRRHRSSLAPIRGAPGRGHCATLASRPRGLRHVPERDLRQQSCSDAAVPGRQGLVVSGACLPVGALAVRHCSWASTSCLRQAAARLATKLCGGRLTTRAALAGPTASCRFSLRP